jgi:hypothetical protein
MNKNLDKSNSGGPGNAAAGTADVVLFSMTKSEDFGNDIRVDDSGTTCNYCNDNGTL